ncbi:maleylpyruvate isomerase family mycothiol-dependent enzyme [Geodermatophilus amargosae]|uniref:maleylpyruvate isomerase family mycothiol-dependent enzyme n=1 Tax=Geodermatophilus amargosae TaxID=1296565 RepID=UPI0034DF8E2D
MTTDEEIRAATAAERREHLALFGSLTAEQWNAPSLCSGWRAKEVLAHTTMPFRWPTGRVLRGMLRARGSFDRFADRAARRDAAELSTDELLASLRDNVDFEWSPPGGGPLGALSHDVIHGLDVSAALGVDDRHASPERCALVLSGLRPKQLRFFGVDLTGVRLRATDADWSHGEGEVVEGRAQDLLLAVCGRPQPAGRLHGAAADRLAAGSPDRPLTHPRRAG